MNPVKGIIGRFDEPGLSASFVPEPGRFNLALWGDFSGAIVVEKSFDDGAAWLAYGDMAAIGIDGLLVNVFQVLILSGPVCLQLHEPEAEIRYRLNATSITSGPCYYRLSQ